MLVAKWVVMLGNAVPPSSGHQVGQHQLVVGQDLGFAGQVTASTLVYHYMFLDNLLSSPPWSPGAWS